MFMPPKLKAALVRIRDAARALRLQVEPLDPTTTPLPMLRRDRALIELCEAIEAALDDL